VFSIPTSTALALLGLFSNYVSMQMAKGRDEGINHPVSSAVDAIPLILST